MNSMKNHSKSIIILLFINLFLLTCTHNKPTAIQSDTDKQSANEDHLLLFDLRRMPELSTVKLSEVGAIEIKYIPLKTSPKNVIPRINNIIFCSRLP